MNLNQQMSDTHRAFALSPESPTNIETITRNKQGTPMKQSHHFNLKRVTINIILAVSLIASNLTGHAADFTEADGSKSDLNQLFIINSSRTFLGYDYLGSDASHHYFVSKWKFARDRHFKVKLADLAVKKTIPFGKGAVEVFPIKLADTGYVEFGKIADRTNTYGGGKTLFTKK
jgi:hypothetical protein